MLASGSQTVGLPVSFINSNDDKVWKGRKEKCSLVVEHRLFVFVYCSTIIPLRSLVPFFVQ